MSSSSAARMQEAQAIRISMVGESQEYYERLRTAAVIHEPRLEFVGFSYLHFHPLAEAKPDMVLLQSSSEEVIVELLNEIENIAMSTRVLLLTPHDDEVWLQRVSGLGVDYCLLQPVDIPTLLRRMVQLAIPVTDARRVRREQKRWAREWKAEKLLLSLGVPSHYKGFAYLKTAIAIAVEDEDVLGRLTHHLYPLVAALHRVSPVHVERSIRHAIEVTCIRGDIQQMHAIFSYAIDQDKGKPTNGLFIARLADHLRLEQRAAGTV